MQQLRHYCDSLALAGLSFIAAAKPKTRLTRALNDSRVAADAVEDNIINPRQAFASGSRSELLPSA